MRTWAQSPKQVREKAPLETATALLVFTGKYMMPTTHLIFQTSSRAPAAVKMGRSPALLPHSQLPACWLEPLLPAAQLPAAQTQESLTAEGPGLGGGGL